VGGEGEGRGEFGREGREKGEGKEREKLKSFGEVWKDKGIEGGGEVDGEGGRRKGE
jgi:hypothetical protein